MSVLGVPVARETPIDRTHILVWSKDPRGPAARHQDSWSELSSSEVEHTYTSIRAREAFMVCAGYVGSGVMTVPLTCGYGWIELSVRQQWRGKGLTEIASSTIAHCR